MDQTTVVTEPQFAALADKLDGMAEHFDEEERVALHALFELAGAALSDDEAEDADDVSGFTMQPPVVGVKVDLGPSLATFTASFQNARIVRPTGQNTSPMDPLINTAG